MSAELDFLSDGRNQPEWTDSTIQGVADAVSTGPFGSLLHKHDYISGGVPVVNPVNLVDGLIQHNENITVSEETAKRLSAYCLRPGDILVGRRGDIGRCALVSDSNDGWLCGTGCFFVRPSKTVDPKFLALLLGSPAYRKRLQASSTGTTMLNLSNNTLSRLPIRIPPLEEQKRIVAVLDRAFAALDRARTHAEANLADAERLSETFLDDQIESLTNTFGRIRVDAIAEVKGGKRLPKGVKPEGQSTPYPYITVRDMDSAGSVTENTVGFISETTQHSIRRYTISCADVYISIAGTIGKTGVVPEGLDGANLTENAAKLVLADRWLRDFVYWSTRSTDFRDQTAEQTRVAAQPKLALQRLGCITIPNADRKSQDALVENMVRFREGITAATSSYRKKLADLANLRQSLLQKAFSGELT